MKNLIECLFGFFIIKTNFFTITLGLAGIGLLSACSNHPALLEPTGHKKISFEQANADLAKKTNNLNTVNQPSKELEQLQQEITGLKQLLGKLSTPQSNTYKNNPSPHTAVLIQAKSFDSKPVFNTIPINPKEVLRNTNSSTSPPPPLPTTVLAMPLSKENEQAPAKNPNLLPAAPPHAQILQIEADARLLAFHVLASDKTIINTLRRWAEQEQWSVKLNGELIDKQHFPAHTVAYTDFSHGEKINSIGGATLLQAVANLMHQLKPYQHQIQLDVQLRKTESQMVLTASAKATNSQANSLASTLSPPLNRHMP